ncbi:unnamed protein product [Trypanosoma congolense IL3000]|uniref:WGS project CAEQ00000000 data, annotated contig 698 n=1 Tax=Trypanosoma congolense (strain IL3000) TaxID=1068625 RepID=F9WHW4_TRYCI|nr:unnamed protein product [Trypanosoma congolense IL3000]
MSDESSDQAQSLQSPKFPTLTLPKVLVEGHMCCTNSVVDVFQVDHSDFVRTYRVCRRSRHGFRTNIPFLNQLSYVDVMFAALFVGLFVDRYDDSSSRLGSFMAGEQTLGNVSGVGPREIYPVWWPSLAALVLLLYVFVMVCRIVSGLLRVNVEEVTAIRGLGLQLNSYHAFGTLCSRRFIDIKLLRSLVIHDAFFRSQAIFFLSATVENEASRVVLFEETLPRLSVIQPVLCGLRFILFEEPEHVGVGHGIECRKPR